MLINLRQSCPQEGTYQKLPSFDFGLDDDEGEIRFWVHVARQLLNEGYLRFYSLCATVDQVVWWITVLVCQLCMGVVGRRRMDLREKFWGAAFVDPRSC